MISELLQSKKVIVCSGTGGVGKTTLSAALGVFAAEQGLKVLVLTIDPARRLASALGLDEGQLNSPVRVNGQNYSGELYACMVDPKLVFENFVREATSDASVVEKLLKNKLFIQLSTTLSGSQEFTSLELLLKLKQSNDFDLIILDTPPSQHAIDFLKAPEKIYSLFKKSVTKWFRSNSNGGIIGRFLGQGTKLAFSALERLTGSTFIGELRSFFDCMSELETTVAERSLEVQKLLYSSETSFLLIASLNEEKILEAEDFQRELKKMGAHLSLGIINRARPRWLVSFEIPEPPSSEWRQARDLFDKFEKDYEVRKLKVDKSLNALNGPHLPLLFLPELREQIVGLKGLEIVANQLDH